MSFNGLVKGQAGALADVFASAPRDIFAGLISSLVAVTYGLSFAALIFAPPLAPWLAYGLAATFLTTAVSAAFLAVRGSLPFTIAGPDGATAAITATLVANFLEKLSAHGAPDDLLAPVMIVMGLSAALTGLLLVGLGVARAGGAIRFVPYPVVGGFLGATGWLMVNGAARVVTDTGLSFSTLTSWPGLSITAKIAATTAVAVALHFGLRRRGDSPYVLPGILLATGAAAYVAFAASGMSPAEARAEGWLFKPPPAGSLSDAWDLTDLRMFPWEVLGGHVGDLLAVMFVTAITMLLNTTGIEFATRREADLQRDLKTLGVANLVSSAFGGYVSCISLSRTTLNYAAGGRGRLSGLVVAVVAALVLAANPAFLSYVPKFILGGLLLYLGFSLIYEWLIDSARRISLLEYGSLLAIALLSIQIGFIAGVLIGVIIGCATFAFSASRVNTVKFSFDGSEYRSMLDREPGELAILAAHGREIQGVTLQSYLFFGSADRLYQQVKLMFANRPDCRFLLFDFRLVTGIDSSAIHSFTKIKQAADELGARLVLVDVSPELRERFSSLISQDVIVAEDLDRALEACEKEVIARHARVSSEDQGLRDWFTQCLGSSVLADRLIACCQRLEISKGAIVAAQGDPADCMHFIAEGRIGVLVRLDDGRSVRVRSLGPHTTIGEMGLITRQMRSATIQAEVDSVLYALTVEEYERLKAEDSSLHQALLAYVVTVMAERLNFASKAIGVLRR